MSIVLLRNQLSAMYSRGRAPRPRRSPEKRKTIGISGVDHQGFALTEPKMNPT
jgi:hypothetical protein